jgi:hypothetical protein
MNIIDDVADSRFDRKVRRVIRELGERALAELIREHCALTMTRTSFECRLDEYLERLAPEMLRATGGDRFPASPLRLVRQ